MNGALRVPVLVAGDFVLRPWRMEDLPLVHEASSDPYIPLLTSVPAVYSDEAGERFVRRQWQRASDGVGYSFVIADRQDLPLGVMSLRMRDAPEGRASLGYWLVESARGRGAVAAALRAVSTWAFEELSIARLELYVEPWNTASARSAERAGFQREGLLRSWQRIGEERRDMTMYALLATDAREAAAPGSDPRGGASG
ncbi:GNAT family N-acetyltransferase [Actinacidiphila acidipaludis]|uniref:GNAT family N-acetyltransferase n=1 Tax=Actinacidiphila acidipaludis TaxID=2873382 RepID=A0ABS7Q4A7_9ACTN|nr:GNAT family N-acetyltransferase [Streptomyces acidipaludis]MBY8877990.1 GNAT family N-acetyltransferase [Streptomyces acidipaludis]